MKKILVACDDRALAMLYSLELTEEGYDTVITTDWHLTTESLEKDRPDLVLVDWSGDRYRDSNFCSTVQAGPYKIPVIHCLDYRPTKHDLQFLCGDYFVLKSSNLQELKTTINRIWRGDPPVEAAETPPAVTRPPSVPSTQISFTWE
jgi:DNA-binding response OmpR family regulator